jgi:hypothetical protein
MGEVNASALDARHKSFWDLHSLRVKISEPNILKIGCIYQRRKRLRRAAGRRQCPSHARARPVRRRRIARSTEPRVGLFGAGYSASGRHLVDGRSARYSGLPAMLLVLMIAAAISAPAHGASADQARPYSCRLLDDEQKKCAFGACDARAIDRLRKECLCDGGRP